MPKTENRRKAVLEVCFPWAGKHQKYQLSWNCSLIGSWKGGVVGNCMFLLKNKQKSSRNIWLLQLCPNKTLILKIDIFLRGSLENHAVWHRTVANGTVGLVGRGGMEATHGWTGSRRETGRPNPHETASRGQPGPQAYQRAALSG